MSVDNRKFKEQVLFKAGILERTYINCWALNQIVKSMEKEQKELEWAKIAFDWCKHISTLSAGSILLVITFLEKLKTQPDWKFLVPTALIAFVVTIVGTFLLQLAILTEEGIHGDIPPLGWVGTTVTIIGFLSGIIALALFGLKNAL